MPRNSSSKCVEMTGGRVSFIGGVARFARPHAARRVVRPCSACSLPRGDLIRHAAPPPNPPRFSRTYRFSTWFLGQLLEAFWYSKWVMQHAVRNLAMSTFQQYKVRTNQSLDGRVMAPRSRGVRNVFSRFSNDDSGQMGEATGEPRVASRSWSYSLSFAPKLADQLAVSRKDSTREGGCPGGKARQIFSTFFLFFVCVCAPCWLSSQRRISTSLVPLESLRYTLS